MLSAEPTPQYTIHDLRAQPFPERMRMICQSWALQVYATPAAVMLGYVFKIAFLYIGGWCFFCSFTPGMGSPLSFGTWAFSATAFQKAILWSLTYEGMGLGCSTGPMTGRILPPIGGVLNFLRPRTTKLPVFPGLPIVGGTRRTWFDVLLYAATWSFLFRALMSPEITVDLLLPVAVLLPILGLSDQTIFLSARGEHYYTALVCLLCIGDGAASGVWIAGCKMVWVAIWFWAATSKLNRHFPGVVCVMLTNSPFIPERFHRRLYRDYPRDLRPSSLASTIAHCGTFAEYAIPLALLASAGGPLTVPALIMMCCFHLFIAGNFPMGMPVEWNVAMVYGGIALFGTMGTAPISALSEAPALVVFLVAMLVVVPLYGNFVPARVSFLLSMRYYAGNWAYSVWLFRGDSSRKLDKLVTPTPLLRDQLAKVVDDPDQVEMAIVIQPAFRLMHVEGRVLHAVLPKAVDDIDDYEWMDGEMVAGMALGWNFGDGHLHDEQLIAAIQEQCDFAPAELRVVIVESQPLFGPTMAWRIVDAATGELDRGVSRVADIADNQPWPTGEDAEAYSAAGGAGTAGSPDG